jgi:hypothetical protein
MNHTSPKPNRSFRDQPKALYRQLWKQFVNSLDPYQRALFYQTIKPRPRKRLERALVRFLDVCEKIDIVIAKSESARG